MSEFTGGYPFELLPTEDIVMNCWERVWLPGNDAPFDYEAKEKNVTDVRPKVLIDLDEALNYGEQQGSLIVVHKTVDRATDLPGECNFDDFSQFGYRTIWEIPYEEWAFNEIVFFYNFFLLYPGKYFLYMQMEDKYFLCAEPKEHTGIGYREFYPTHHYDKVLPQPIVSYGHFELARFEPFGFVNCPVPIEHILGTYLTTLNNLPPELPVDYFDTISNEYVLYVDTSYMRWSIDDEETVGSLHTWKTYPKDFLKQGFKRMYISFGGFERPIFKQDANPLHPDNQYRNEHRAFLHFRDWDGSERVVSILKLIKVVFADGEKAPNPSFICTEKPEGGNDMQ